MVLDSERYAAVCAPNDGAALLLLASDKSDCMSYRVVDCMDALACEIFGGSATARGAQAARSVRITIKDPRDPYFTLGLSDPASATGLAGRVEVAIRRGEKLTQEPEAGNAVDPLAVPDAIMKLVTLKEQGHITPDQFEQQKSLLLGVSQPKPKIESKTSQWVRSAWQNPAVNMSALAVPDLTGKTILEAKRVMEQAGYSGFQFLSYGTREVAGQYWLVVSQDPLPGTEIGKGIATLYGVPPEKYPF